MIKEFLGLFDERSRYINVSDGIHSGDNYGLISLVRRQVENIVICDTTSVDQYLASDNCLAQTLELTKNYGVEEYEITTELVPQAKNKAKTNIVCEKCTSLGKIYYQNGKESNLFYLRAVVTKDAPKRLKEYQARFKEFPFESLNFKNFDTAKFDAYLQLGEFLGKKFEGVLEEAKHKKLKSLKDFRDLIAHRITQIEKDLGDDSWVEPKPEGSEAEIALFNQRLEKLIHIVRELIILSDENEEKIDLTGFEESRALLIEKLGYLRLERAKLSGGSKKFQITKELEETERELQALESQMKDTEDDETSSKLLNLKGELGELLVDWTGIQKNDSEE